MNWVISRHISKNLKFQYFRNQVDTNTLKLTAARLETIASHYNKLRSKIRPHEEQLFTAKITQIEALLKQGIGLG